MDELMQKITEKLNLTIDKAPEVYEMLKWQYVVYDAVNQINAILYILLFVAGGAEVILLLFTFDDVKINKRIILLSFIPFVVMILLIIILLIYRNINAPDVLFLKGVLGK